MYQRFSSAKNKVCECCGFICQDTALSLCDSIEEMQFLGISTFLYFRTIFNLTLIISFMFCFVGVYSLAANLFCSTKISLSSIEGSFPPYLNFILNVSLYSKMMFSASDASGDQYYEKVRYYLIELWMGVGMIVLWGFLFFLLRYLQKDKEINFLKKSTSVAELSIVIDDMPTSITQ